MAASGHGRSHHPRPAGLRLASLADRQLLIQSIRFSPENYSGVVSIGATVGGSLITRTATGETIALAAATRVVDLGARTTVSEDLPTPQSLNVGIGKAYQSIAWLPSTPREIRRPGRVRRAITSTGQSRRVSQR